MGFLVGLASTGLEAHRTGRRGAGSPSYGAVVDLGDDHDIGNFQPGRAAGVSWA